MDESFFVKYAIQIKKQKNSKEEIISLIKDSTGIELGEDMFTLTKKQIVFHVSSVMKQKLFQKNSVKVLEEKGYMIKF